MSGFDLFTYFEMIISAAPLVSSMSLTVGLLSEVVNPSEVEELTSGAWMMVDMDRRVDEKV